MKTILKIDNVNKELGKRHIIKDLSFETYEGEVFGFLGPNGAGKTTTIKMVVGMIGIDSGKIYVDGVDVEKDFEKAIQNIGAIVENPEMYKYMSGWKNLKQFARIRKVSDEQLKEIVELVGLSNRIHDEVKKYSLGMRQRLGLAQAMMHNPKLIILDEPTNGLDPAGIKELRNILKNLAHEKGCSVIVSSHLMSEMELMCDRVAILLNGELKSMKTIEEMKAECENANIQHYKIIVDNVKIAKEILEELDIDDFEEINSQTIKIGIKKENDIKVQQIIKVLGNNDVEISGVELIEKSSLEDVFLEMTKEGGNQIA